jgi:CelD/BcsL family acetyltransferase involved in cellulose biosynthesis
MNEDGLRLEERSAEGPAQVPAADRAPAGTGLEGQWPVEQATRPSRATIQGGDVELSLIHDLAAAAALWAGFEDRASHTFFQTFAWLEAWQAHVGVRTGTLPAIVTGRHPDGTLLLVLPLAVERRHAVRYLTFLGSDLCDYNAPLLHPEFDAIVDYRSFATLWGRILSLLRADRRLPFDVIDLPKMPDEVGEQRNPLLALPTRPNPSGAYLATLGGSWNEFYERKRSAATRKKERKQLRQLAEFGEVRFVDRLDGAERVRTLDVLFEQKAQSLARMGVRNIFKRPGYGELFRAFATEARSRHLVHLSRLEVGSTIAATSLGFIAGSRYYLVLSSYDAGPIARLGPGRAHLQEVLRFAIRSGIRWFDFTIGDEPYKQDWSDTRSTLHDHLSPASPTGVIVVAAITAFRKTKRAIKQNVALWRVFTRARSRLAALRRRSSSERSDHGASSDT